MSTCILTTTIHIPHLLRDYALNAREYGHQEVEFVIVGDRKTPNEIVDLAKGWGNETGCSFTVLDAPAQLDYLGRFPRFGRMIPWNCQQRRNVGLLYSIETGHDHVITIDDDNFLLPGCDFIGEHCQGLGLETEGAVTSSNTGWFNCIGMMRSN